MTGIIIRLKAECDIQEKMAEIAKGRIYDSTSQEWYEKQLKNVESFKMAISILEENNK